jgi:putative toxin-antitoxin system antitoxin component (TIGR02293 family)
MTKTSSLQTPEPKTRRLTLFRIRGASIGLTASDTSDLLQQIEKGFAYEALLKLEINSGLPLALLTSVIGIPERTLARRRAAGRLEPDESERLLRVAILFEKCVDLFEGDVKAAANWLTSPKKALNGQAPVLYARTELGAREVENLIGRLDHGIFS